MGARPAEERRAQNDGDIGVDESDLAANTDQIMAGGTMSILRRKGKQFKDRRGGPGCKDNATRFNYELLSGDIQTLL